MTTIGPVEQRIAALAFAFGVALPLATFAPAACSIPSDLRALGPDAGGLLDGGGGVDADVDSGPPLPFVAPDFQVNEMETAVQEQPAVAADEALGRFVVVWRSTAVAAAGAIAARAFGSTGAPAVALGSEAELISDAEGMTWPAVAAHAAEGRIVVAGLRGTAPSIGLRVGIFQAGGVTVAAPLTVDPCNQGELLGPSASVASNVTMGSVAAFRLVVAGAPMLPRDSVVALDFRYDTTLLLGNCMGAGSELLTGVDISGADHAFVPATSGGRVVVLLADDGAVRLEGVGVVTPGTLGATAGHVAVAGCTSADRAGLFWVDAGRLWGTVVDAGSVSLAPVDLAPAAAMGPRLDAAMNGACDEATVAWTDSSLDTDGVVVAALVVAMPDGVPPAPAPNPVTGVAAPFVVPSTTNGPQQDAAIATLPDGTTMIVWTDGSFVGPDTEQTSIRGRVLPAWP